MEETLTKNPKLDPQQLKNSRFLPVLKKEWLWLSLIVAINLILSGTYLYQLYQTELIDLNFQDGFDSLTYHLRGISVADGDYTWLISKQSLYHAIVGAIYAVFGVKPFLVFVFQILLCSSACILLYALGKKIFSPAVGLLAAGIWAFYPVSIYYTGILARVTMVTFIDLLMIYVFTLCLEKKNFMWYALAFLTCALAISGRYNILLFIVVFFIWALFYHYKLLKRLKSLDPAIFITLGFFIPVLALVIWSQSYDVPQMTQWIAGNSYDSTGFYCVPNQGVIPIFSKDFLLRQFHKTFLFFNTFEAPNNFNYYLFREKIPLLQYIPLCFGIIFPFAMVGFVSAFINKKKIITVTLFVFFYSISIILFFISSRHRLPIVPLLVLMMAYGIYDLFCKFKEKRYRIISIKMAILLSIMLFSIWRPQHIKDVENYFNDLHRMRFSAFYIKKGKKIEAIQELKRAITEVPTSWAAYINLAHIYVNNGQYQKAIETYDKVISLKPDIAAVYSAKGQSLAQLSRLDEAEENLKKAISLKPRDPFFYYYLGNVLIRKKSFNKAKEAFQKALSLNSDNALAHLNLGILYWQHFKDKNKAVFHLKRFLGLSPSHPECAAVKNLLRGIVSPE